MAESYSTSLKITLIGDGDQAGTWGDTTNTNWNLVEQAITGVDGISMPSSNTYTLTNLNGTSDDARNMVLVVGGTPTTASTIVAPLVNKFYIITNNTNYNLTMSASGGSVSLVIPALTTAQCYCDAYNVSGTGTGFYSAQTGSAGNFTINGNLTVSGNVTETGNFLAAGVLGAYKAASFVGGISNGSGASGTTLNVTAVNSGVIFIGQRITGTGISSNTEVTGFGTGSGGTGTYTVNNTQLVTPSTSMTGLAGAVATTPVSGDNSVNIATTAFVQSALSGAFISGMIMMWSGTIATIPSGWLLCNGSNGTPDLRNKFIVGAYEDSAGVASTTITGSDTQTGGSKDAIVVSHTHTASVTDPGHTHITTYPYVSANPSGTFDANASGTPHNLFMNTMSTATTGISVSNSTTGSSGTNANLVPYYALAFIMKS